MSVGTGIFLGLAILATVLLYAQTKDRWRWRSIAKWTALIIAVPILVVALWVGYTTLKSYLGSRPKRVTTYADISLGDTKADVRYAKGEPTEVLVDDTTGEFPFPGVRTNIKLSDIPSGKQLTDYRYWDYDSAELGRIDVDFSPESQRVIRVFCYAGTLPGSARSCPLLLGVSAGATEEEVVKRLGTPSKSEISEGFATAKTLYYSQWNVAFLLEKRRVYGLRIESTDALTAPTTIVSRGLGPSELGKKPPAECATAKTADECADILTKAGKNSFDAYGFVGAEPVYRGQNEAPPPPCKNGESTCEPWERDWKSGDIKPGATVTDTGTIVRH